MDADRFDALSRALTTSRSRRATLGALLGTLLGSALPRSLPEALAAPGKGKGKSNGGDGTKQDRHAGHGAATKHRKQDHATTPMQDPRDAQAPERGETNDGQRRNGATGTNQPADRKQATRKARAQDPRNEPPADPLDDQTPAAAEAALRESAAVSAETCLPPGAKPCRQGSDCCSGRCKRRRRKCLACPTGTAYCAPLGACVDPSQYQTDPDNCGSCGNRCTDGETCQGGECVVVGCGGTICHFDNAQAFCQDDTCTMGTCDGGWANCNGQTADGCETNIATDVNNCGRCNERCNSTNATPTCVDGICRVVCDEGFANCDGSAFSGCEIDIRTNRDHCGECNHACFFPNAGSSCQDGTCMIGECADKRIGDFVWGNCDGDPSTGCETDILNDSAHCGGCGQACPEGQVCFSGKCERPCEAGGPCRVFVTARVSTGNLGGLAGADTICQESAQAAHLPGTYMAWLSDDTASPGTRFPLRSPGPYWTVDRVKIADNWADLTDGTLDETISVTATGFPLGTVPRVWTHTRPDGTAGGVGNVHCQNWTSAGCCGGDTGWFGLVTSEWTENQVSDCFLLRRLYCFQQSG